MKMKIVKTSDGLYFKVSKNHYAGIGFLTDTFEEDDMLLIPSISISILKGRAFAIGIKWLLSAIYISILRG